MEDSSPQPSPGSVDPDFSAYVSVDVEAAGPTPEVYSLLAIGACLVADPQQSFYAELQPINNRAIPEAMVVHGLSLDELAECGLPPTEAMYRFANWLDDVIQTGKRPLFVAFNAPFDWMFVNHYFHRYLGHNPFGHAALDIKAFYMGMKGVPWGKTSMQEIAKQFPLAPAHLSHHALEDARGQAEIFRQILAMQLKNP